MNKYMLLILVILGLTSCTVEDEHYYRSNPKELQKAIKACPGKQPQNLTCQQVDALGSHMNSLAYQLQSSPQGFGSKILALQQTIASQQRDLQQATSTKNGIGLGLEASLTQNQNELASLLAVVKWMESPGS
ncbi:MAG: hypothetical protein ACHP65_06300 [Legionellales bacterium]